MSSYLSLDPVSAAVYAALNVAAFTDLSTGGVGDNVAQNTEYPFTLYEVDERTIGGLGTKAGSSGRVMEVSLRVHVFVQYGGFLTAHVVMAKAIELLRDALTVAGYRFCGEPFHDSTTPLSDVEVAGVKVKELVADFRLYVEGA